MKNVILRGIQTGLNNDGDPGKYGIEEVKRIMLLTMKCNATCIEIFWDLFTDFSFPQQEQICKFGAVISTRSPSTTST